MKLKVVYWNISSIPNINALNVEHSAEDTNNYLCVCVCVSIYVYIYIYVNLQYAFSYI